MSEVPKQLVGKGFKPGQSGNPDGRPKGKTMKEFAREFLMEMTDEDKLSFLKSLSKDIVWKMAEGNPKQDTDITSDGERIIFNADEQINKIYGETDKDGV